MAIINLSPLLEATLQPEQQHEAQPPLQLPQPTGNLTDVVRMLLEDRQHRETDQMIASQERQMRLLTEQMRSMQTWISSQGRATVQGPRGREQPKLSKLTDSEDIEAFLKTFDLSTAADRQGAASICCTVWRGCCQVRRSKGCNTETL